MFSIAHDLESILLEIHFTNLSEVNEFISNDMCKKCKKLLAVNNRASFAPRSIFHSVS